MKFFFLLFCPALFSLDVLVTLPPFEYFVEAIGGDLVQVETLVPAGASPHSWEPTPQQVKRAVNAELWFRVGEPIEERVPATMKVVDLAEGLDLVKGCPHCKDADLHFWLSARMAKVFSKIIANALIEEMPHRKGEIEANLNELLMQLDDLDAELSQKLAPCKGSAIVVSHPAFTYFCRDYGLVQLPIEQEGKEPSSRQLLRLIQEAKQKKARVVIVQQQFNPKAAKRVATELNLQMCDINPLAADPLNTMKQLAFCICQPSS